MPNNLLTRKQVCQYFDIDENTKDPMINTIIDNAMHQINEIANALLAPHLDNFILGDGKENRPVPCGIINYHNN